MTEERRQRHTHPAILFTVVLCAFAVLAVQGVVLGLASDTAAQAKETAAVARDVTDPNCDRSRPGCRRAQERSNGQSTVVVDINEVSVIGAYCARQHAELAAVRACVGDEFRRLTGRPAGLAPTTTTPGG